MARQNSKNKLKTAKSAINTQPIAKSIRILSDLRANDSLYFKIRLLIHDLRHMSTDKSCEKRTLQTTDVHYLSAPYFSPEEAAIVKAAIVDEVVGVTVEQALTSALEGFLKKREASGDFRPCGPHDLVPIYLKVFGVGKEELEDEAFVRRVRRWGGGKG